MCHTFKVWHIYKLSHEIIKKKPLIRYAQQCWMLVGVYDAHRQLQ